MKKQILFSQTSVPDFYPENKDKKYVINHEWYNQNKNNILCASINKHKESVFFSTKSRTLVFFKKR